jgi:hypothetical protein
MEAASVIRGKTRDFVIAGRYTRCGGGLIRASPTNLRYLFLDSFEPFLPYILYSTLINTQLKHIQYLRSIKRMSSSLPGIRELPRSQYDLTTYWGRVRESAGISDPRYSLPPIDSLPE